MATYHNGYKDIKVKLLCFEGENLAKRCYEFGVYGTDSYKLRSKTYSKDSEDTKLFINELISGKTFPKFAFVGTRIDFAIEGISRICLAQLTRDNAIFCSESHGLRPLSQEFNIPSNMYNDTSIMDKVKKAQSLIEEAYIEACEKELPYPETRYICLHSQTISLTCSFTPADFARACYSRTNNSFCDELNYVYRKMFFCLMNAIENIEDNNSKRIWRWLINEKKCIDDSYYTRTNVFNGDFLPFDEPNIEQPAQNDWRKSCWKIELERMLLQEPELLTHKEISVICRWIMEENEGNELNSTYEQDNERIAKNAIKETDYYKEHKDVK